jgi:thiamine biosynthesis lipoprotein ApbE
MAEWAGEGIRYRTSGLGTVAEVVVTEASCLAEAAMILNDELDRIDRIASRFRADSELMQLQRSPGRGAPASPGLCEAVGVALALAEVTNGLIDPTVGTAMRNLGYDRDFQAIAGGVAGRVPPPRPVPGWRLVVMDAEAGTIDFPPGVELDLGASAKALAVDRVAERVGQLPGCGVLVSIGGDIAVAGNVPPSGFAVGVTDVCTDPVPDETVAVHAGGVATSGTAKRRWKLGSADVHHIVDPATGLPAVSPWRTVTVCARDCVQANGAATAALVMGATGFDWLASLGLAARLVTSDGEVTRTPAWPSPVSSSPTHESPGR